MSDDLPKVDIAYYRERLASRRRVLGGNLYNHANKRVRVEFGVKVTCTDLETLIHAYERMIGERCRACGSDTHDRFCHCENDE